MAGKTAEERITAIDEKIAKKQAEIEALEAQKQKLLHPVNLKTVMAAAKKAGLTPEEIAEKLEYKPQRMTQAKREAIPTMGIASLFMLANICEG
mgnify:CR=1 FL=1